MGRRVRRTLKSVLALLLLSPAAPSAMPVAPTVVSGSASFQLDGPSLAITAASGTVIDWEVFSIGAGEAVRFVQASASSSVLNRVTGAVPVTLAGALFSNGAVAVESPGGFSVAPGGWIEAGRLTLSMASADVALAGLVRVGNWAHFAGSSIQLAGSLEAGSGVQLVSGSFAGEPSYRAGLAYQATAPGGAITLTSGRLDERGGSLAAGSGTLTLISSGSGGSVDITNGNPSIVTLASDDPGMGVSLVATPLPAAAWLLLTGLLGVFGAGRWRSKR